MLAARHALLHLYFSAVLFPVATLSGASHCAHHATLVPSCQLSQVQLPNARQREAILRLTLRRHAFETEPAMVERELWPILFRDPAVRASWGATRK